MRRIVSRRKGIISFYGLTCGDLSAGKRCDLRIAVGARLVSEIMLSLSLSAVPSYTIPAAPRTFASAPRCNFPVMADGSSFNVGVLAIQVGFSEHMDAIRRQSGVEAIEVRNVADLEKVDAIILPGGESTAIGHGLVYAELLDPLRDFIKSKPAWGVCAPA